MRACLLLLVVFASTLTADDSTRQDTTGPVDLILVAGQSNAVGYDAKPGELPADVADQQIRFWWRCGDPPPDEHDSTSSGGWTHLQPQPLGTPRLPREGRQYGNFAQPEGGFGPEIGLARTLYAREQKPLAVIKVAFSGTSLTGDWNATDAGESGACYRALVSETREAMAAAQQQGLPLRPRALVWVQGESDANAERAGQYARDLGVLLDTLRTDIDAPELTALVAVNTRFGGGGQPHLPTVIAQQQLLAARDPHTEYVDTSQATTANAAHFDTAGTLEVGRLCGESLLRHEARRQPAQRTLTVVTLGDSITKGVRGGVTAEQTFAARLESELSQPATRVRVINVGIGGERTDQALGRLANIIALQPDMVTIMYGTNDSYIDQGKSTSRLTPDQYGENLTNIVTELMRQGIRPILMTPPRWAADASVNGIGRNPNEALIPFLDVCRSVASTWRVPLVDHFADWSAAEADGLTLRDWTTDGCHPNPAGHQRLVDAIRPVVMTSIGPALTSRQKLLAGEPVRVVCFGDSVTGVYYHTGSRRAYTDMLGIALQRIAQTGTSVTMINAGISGHTTENALARIDADVLQHKPDLVTVMFGLNDMTRVPLEAYRNNLREIVERCRAAGAEVVLATPNNVIDTEPRPALRLTEYCDAIREVGGELKVPVCDCYREMEAVRYHDPFGWRLLMSDAIHPNMDGHQVIAEQLAHTILGIRVSLGDVRPAEPMLPHTRSRLPGSQPVRVLAMAPVDTLVAGALQQLAPEAKVEVTRWDVAGLTLAQIEQDAKVRVREMKPDLVLLAVPDSAAAETAESFAGSFAWVMNWSLNFGAPTWDCVVVHPAVIDATETAEEEERHDLIRRLVAAQDLPLVDRASGEEADAATILKAWFAGQSR